MYGQKWIHIAQIIEHLRTSGGSEILNTSSIQDLIGMRGDTFISWFFLDQILSGEFLSKVSKLFSRWKLPSIGLIWHPAKLFESYKKMPLGGAKDEHFSCFHSSCQWGLMTWPAVPTYSAAQAGMITYTRSAGHQLEYQVYRFRFICLCSRAYCWGFGKVIR